MATGNEKQTDETSAAMEDVKERAASGAQDIKEGAKERAEHLSTTVGERANNLAEVVRSAGESARGKEDWLANAADGISRQLESFSASAREKGLEGLKSDAERLAREKPALFMGMAVTAGVALGRLLRSSPPAETTGGGQPMAGQSPSAQSPGAQSPGAQSSGAQSPAGQPRAGEQAAGGDAAAGPAAQPSRPSGTQQQASPRTTGGQDGP